MKRRRRRFGEAARKAYVADGLTCNWTIHATHFADYVPILDFTHVVSYLFTASRACFGKTEQAWNAYVVWMTAAWRGEVDTVIDALERHQERIGLPAEDADADDPAEQLRRVIGYLQNNRSRMRLRRVPQAGLPTTSALDGIGRERDELPDQGNGNVLEQSGRCRSDSANPLGVAVRRRPSGPPADPPPRPNPPPPIKTHPASHLNTTIPDMHPLREVSGVNRVET